MSIIKTKHYTTICNRIVEEKKISMNAKGLYFVLSTASDEYLNITLGEKIKYSHTVNSALKELIRNGYVMKHNDGTYEVFDIPTFGNIIEKQ